VSFSCYAGEVFGLLGPNGAGKTTTIRMLTTVLRPTSGTARVAGRDVVGEAEEVRGAIGVLPENAGVYGRLTGREAIRYAGSCTASPATCSNGASSRWPAPSNSRSTSTG
jgi:ABC-type multidrug transport system ATPase subunit